MRGATLKELQELLGHSSLTMMMRLSRNSSEEVAPRAFVEVGGLMSYGANLADLLPSRGDLRGQDPQGRKARRSTRGTAREIRPRYQHEDRQGADANDPSNDPSAGGPSHRIACSTTLTPPIRSARLPPAINRGAH